MAILCFLVCGTFRFRMFDRTSICCCIKKMITSDSSMPIHAGMPKICSNWIGSNKLNPAWIEILKSGGYFNVSEPI